MPKTALEQTIDDLIRGRQVVVYAEPQTPDPADPCEADFALCPPTLLTPMLNHDELFLLDFSCTTLTPDQVEYVQGKIRQNLPAVENNWYLATLTLHPTRATHSLHGLIVTSAAPFIVEDVFLNFIW